MHLIYIIIIIAVAGLNFSTALETINFDENVVGTNICGRGYIWSLTYKTCVVSFKIILALEKLILKLI